MSDPIAELSSVATALDELATRLGKIAEENSSSDDTIATELFEVERALSGAQRRLAKLVEAAPKG